MRLISDYSKLHVNVNGVEIVIAPDSLPPFNVSAVVEEQDVALILSEAKEIQQPDDKPIWYLSHKLESQPVQTPGSVIIRYETPLRLLAIVHDFDRDPSWKAEWVASALQNIFKLAEKKDITSLQLPVLGAQYGRFDLYDFLKLLVLELTKRQKNNLKRIWLLMLSEDCDKAFERLKENLTEAVGDT